MPEIIIPNLTDSQKIFAAIMENQISVNTALNDLQESVSKHQKILVDGNGEIPLVEKIRNHEAFIGGTKYWMRFIGGALIIQTIAFATSVVIAVVRFLPLLEKLAQNP